LHACYLLNVSTVRADIVFHWAGGLHAQGIRPGSLYAYDRAVSLSPHNYDYRIGFSRALRDLAEPSSDDGRFRNLMTQAEQVLLEIQKDSVLNRAAYHLGELYLLWGMREKDPQIKSQVSQKARQAFDQALTFEPHVEVFW